MWGRGTSALVNSTLKTQIDSQSVNIQSDGHDRTKRHCRYLLIPTTGAIVKAGLQPQEAKQNRYKKTASVRPPELPRARVHSALHPQASALGTDLFIHCDLFP